MLKDSRFSELSVQPQVQGGAEPVETIEPSSAIDPALSSYILSFCEGSPDAHNYARTHLARLVRTLQVTPGGSASDRVLEMGAYMQITPALHTRLGYGEVRGCYLGPAGTVERKAVTSSAGESFECRIDLFNAEKDQFPYQEDYFATVICCELLEHLAVDPMHMFAEVNRILQPGGHLVLSTPNICSLRSIAAVIGGYHPGLFPHYVRTIGGADANRHEREYAPREIALLLEAAGFSVELLETGPYGTDPSPGCDWVLDLLRQRGESTSLRGDTIHAVARKCVPVKERYPAWLYV